MNRYFKNLRDEGYGRVANMILGVLYHPHDRNDAARENARNDPRDPDAQREYARTAAGIGDFRNGLIAANEAVQLDPSNSENYSTRAQARFQIKDYDGARADARQALSMNPSDPVAQAVLRLSGGQRMPTMELPDTRRPNQQYDPIPQSGATALMPAETGDAQGRQRSMRWTRSGEAALRGRDHQGALRDANLALEADPKNLQAQYLRSMAYVQAGRIEEGLRDAENGLRQAPEANRGTWLTLLANIYNRNKDYVRARAAAEEAVQRMPNSPEAHLSLAWALGGLGERGAAMSALRRAAELDPKYEGYYQAASGLPDGASLAMLFEGAPVLPARPGREPKRRGRGVVLTLAALVGGFLIAMGLLRAASMRRTVAWTPAPSPAAADGRMPGSLRSLYRVTRQIGTGGMGVVYEAVDRNLKRRVAIKQMRPEIRSDARERARFLDEARLVAALRHPNIVEIYSIVEDDSDAYLVFEYVDGKTIGEMMHAVRRFTLRQALPIVRDVAAALDYAHGKGVIHRDLKPSNVMVDSEGRAKVMDFGVARQAKDSLSRLSMTNTVAGTPPYMAPEQEQGMVRKESDAYALAVCLYEMLTGRLPFNGVGAGMLMAKMNKSFAPPSTQAPGLPKEIDEVFARALDPDPDKRWRKAAEMVRALEGLQA